MSSPIYYVSVRKLPGGNSCVTDILYAELKDCACNHSLMDIDTLKLFIKMTQKRLGEIEREHPRTRKRRLREYIDMEDTWISYYAPTHGKDHKSGFAIDCRRVIHTEIVAFKDVMEINDQHLPKQRQLSLNF